MEVIKLTGEIDDTGKLNIDLSTSLSAGKVDLVLIVNPAPKKKNQKNIYDFSNLESKLSWSDDAVKMQRTLRDEW